MLNPKLKPFSRLVGEWNTVGTHALMPDTRLHGHVTFEWIEDGAYLRMHSEVEEEGIPTGTVIFGSDDSSDVVSMLYFDERGVFRIYESRFEGNTWKFWRNNPDFSQRFAGTFTDDNTIQVNTEFSKDGSTWEKELELSYTRVR